MSRSYYKNHLKTHAAIAWSKKLLDAQGDSNLDKADVALQALTKLSNAEARAVCQLIGASSSSAYSLGIRTGKQMQRDNEFRAFQTETDTQDRPANVIKLRSA